MGYLRRLWRWALAIILNVAYFVAPVPAGLPGWTYLVHWGLGALFAICLAGKILYDTLFYDRYLR